MSTISFTPLRSLESPNGGHGSRRNRAPYVRLSASGTIYLSAGLDRLLGNPDAVHLSVETNLKMVRIEPCEMKEPGSYLVSPVRFISARAVKSTLGLEPDKSYLADASVIADNDGIYAIIDLSDVEPI